MIKKIGIASAIGIMVISFTVIYIFENNQKKDSEEDLAFVNKVEEKIETSSNNIIVDIKGQITNPGIYQLKEGSVINDLIIMAGGIKKNGTTQNINLAKQLENEMVIIIKSKSDLSNDLKNSNQVASECLSDSYDCSECLKSDSSIVTPNNNNNTSDIISLNSATKEELMTLNGIGESKALAIIEYRETNNGFKNIEELLEVSGIGNSVFENIKKYIKI